MQRRAERTRRGPRQDYRPVLALLTSNADVLCRMRATVVDDVRLFLLELDTVRVVRQRADVEQFRSKGRDTVLIAERDDQFPRFFTIA